MVTLTKSGLPSKRKPPTNRGSRKGVPNKLTADLKAMILEALDEAGGVKYLVKQANQKNPAAFMALVGKVLPMTVQGTGEDGRIVVEIVRYADRSAI